MAEMEEKMNRREFMKTLNDLLSDLSPSERDEAIEYYTDYMNEAGIKDEDIVPESLGTPQSVADDLKRSLNNPTEDFLNEDKVNTNTPGKFVVNDKKNNRKQKNSNETALIVIICILTCPIWLPLALGVLGTLFGFSIAVISVLFAIGVSSIAVLLAGGIVIVSGIVTLFVSVPEGLVVTGAGMIVFAIGLVIVIAMLNCLCVFIPWLIRTIQSLYRRIVGKRGKRA